MRKAYRFSRNTTHISDKPHQLFCVGGTCDVSWIQVELDFLFGEEMAVEALFSEKIRCRCSMSTSQIERLSNR